jgi:plasmid stability protein
MANITLRDVPDDLRAQLEQEASAHFRTLDQEALARIEMSFQIQEAFNTKRVQNWIDEALASGPEEPLSREEFDAAFQRAVKRFETHDPAAR